MSSVFSKSREKRGRTSSGESNNSFVKNVTSRVSSLLPATITKWFSNASTSSGNGSTPAAEITDSSSDDEGPQRYSAVPSKRRRLRSPGSRFSCIKRTANASTETTPQETEESVSTSVLYSSIQTRKNKQDTNNTPSPTKNVTTETTTVKSEDVPSHSKSQPAVGIFRHSIAPRKSIFDLAPAAKKDKIVKAPAKTASSTPKEYKAPSFNPSLLSSPFYAGRTIYGGASTSTYINRPNIKQLKVAEVKESKNNDSVNISYSARQVMDLLNSFSSPLVEARRIPVISRNPNASHSMTKDSLLPSTSSNNMDYKTQELYVPSIASILRLKQRSRLMGTTKAARQIIASHSSTLSNFEPYTYDNRSYRQQNQDNYPSAVEKEPAKSDITPKMKTRLTRRNRDMIDNEDELPETVELPTAVLQIDKDNLPKFTFGDSTQPSSALKSAKTTFTQTPSEPLTLNKVSKTPEQASVSGSMFKFSSPVNIMDTHQGEVSPPAFTFDSPERRVDNNLDSSNRYAISLFTDNNKKESQSTSESDWKCSECWITNKPTAEKCVCCGAKSPSKDVKQNKTVINTNSMSSTGPTKPSGNWSCPDCWASNPQANEKCLCCGGQNPTKMAAPGIPKTESLAKDWKCEDCWISNKSSVDKCAACGGAKPGTKPTPPSLPASSLISNISKPLVKDQKDNLWQCQTCLVTNSNDKSSCVCCGIEKSGGDKEAAKKLFNFSTNTNVTFKFGIDPKLQEAALKKSEEGTDNAFGKIAEETNNNVVPKIQTSTFTLPTSNIMTKSEDKVESITPTFSFGIPKPTHSLTTEATFTIKQPEPVLKTQKAEDNENPQEVPKIDFKTPIQEATKPSSGFFASSITGKLSEQTAPTFGVFGNSSLDKEKKETLSNPISTASTLTKDEKILSTFTFAAGALKPAVPMFGAPTTSSTAGTPSETPITTNSTLSHSLFQKPETTTSTMSLFQNNETTASTPSTLFQKTETTSAAPSPATSIFSFGSNTLSSTVAPTTSTPDKPKFNFSFGSSTTDNQISGLFKSPFPTTTENNSNKFALPTSNTLGNSLGNNSLSSGNVLGGNTLGGNVLGGNALGGNALTSNPLGGIGLGGNGLGASGLGGNGLGGSGLGGNDLGGNNTMSGNILGSGNDNNMATAPIFGSSMQKDSWTANNASTNVFASSGASNNMTKPAPFTFGTSTPFNAGNAPSNPQPAQNMFGASTPPTQNLFAMGNQNNASQPSLFQNQAQNQPAPMFGTPNPTPSLFGAPAAPAAPTFGTPNQPITSAFDNASAPTPTFNFGQQQQQQTPNVFGFGQAAVPQNAGVYNFGGAAAGSPQQLQFSMGSAPNPNMAVRRMRKAVRRTSQR